MADARIVIKPNATGRYVAYVEKWGTILASTVRPSVAECEVWVKAHHADALRWVDIEVWTHQQHP